MSKKITREEFLRRFKISFPNEDIEIVNFTAMSHPTTIKCKKCGKIHTKSKANNFISDFRCCDKDQKTKFEKIVKILDNSKDFQLIKKIDKDNVIIKHKVCGNEFKRNIQAILMSPETCPHCDTGKQRNMLSIVEVQDRLNKQFNNEIVILEYNGQSEKNHYKCLKCGLIFVRDNISMESSRGCPKCDKNKSKGEKKMAQYLTSKNLKFKEQVSVKELPLQHFDFCIYNDNKDIICYIEINGEQHYEARKFFRDGLKKIQERDERKRKYCKEHNIPLYEIKWIKGQFKNLDILPF